MICSTGAPGPPTAKEVVTLQALLGAGVAFLAALLLLNGGPARNRLGLRGAPMSGAARRGLMGFLIAISAVLALPAVFPPLRGGLFAFCGACPIPSVGAEVTGSAGDLLRLFLEGVWYYAATVLPVFVLASALSGLLATRTTLRVRGVFGAFGLAAVLPLCSCGVIPLGKAMIDRGGRSVRPGLMFIAAAPLLSPIIILLGWTVLGPGYVLVRVAASFVMALAVALLVPAFLPTRESHAVPPTREDHASVRPASEAAPAPPPASEGASSQAPRGSALAAGWSMLASLFRYVLYGVVLGAGVAAALPHGYVSSALGAGALSMAAAVVVGVPINLCAGEEILLTAPLAGAGLTMGHAVAFALAGTGICVSSIPLLKAVLGRKAMLAMVALYLVVPFALGIFLAALPAAPRLAPGLAPENAPAVQAGSRVSPQSFIDKSG